MSADPTNPQSWNRYNYTLNNPLAYVDPNGKEPIKIDRPEAGLGPPGEGVLAAALRNLVLSGVEAISSTPADRMVMGTIALAILPESDAELVVSMVPLARLSKVTGPVLKEAGEAASSLIKVMRASGLKKLDTIGIAGSRAGIRVVTGTLDDAHEMMEAIKDLGGGVVNSKSIGNGTVYELKTGGYVVIRPQPSPTSPNVVANIDVNIPGVGTEKIKVVPLEYQK